MALKIDMEQAYDKMSWTSLQLILSKIGFPNTFSTWIMQCVRCPRFALLLNGTRSPWIEASCGFRQGCPLSPYLFILCSELLSRAFIHHQFRGISLSRGGTRVSHLLYADDILIFANASLRDARMIQNILDLYCNWTGQRINLYKSSILFSKKTPSWRKRHISRLLGFKKVDTLEYLGVTLAMRKLTKHDFGKLLQKSSSKIQRWGLRHLSLAGKMCLLDSSYLALPTFLLTHSHLPRSILYELERRARSFLWNKDDGGRGLHYISWDTLCRPKNCGGFGLHASTKWEGPLKARLTWDFITNRDKFPFFILSEIYGDDPWHHSNGSPSSWAWKTITSGAEYLNPILRWEVHDGQLVHILNSTWILDLPLSKWPTHINMDLIDESSLASLIDENGWITPNLLSLFGPDLTALILQAQKPDTLRQDHPKITPAHSGHTITALAYTKQFDELCKVDLPFAHLKLPPKVSLFWWRLYHDALPSGDWLLRHHISSDNICPRGCLTIEDSFHIMLGCRVVRTVLDLLSKWGFCIPLFGSTFATFEALRNLPKSLGVVGRIFCCAIHRCWLARVNQKHGRPFESPVVIASAVLSSLTHMWSSPILEQWGTSQPFGLVTSFWYPPPPGWLKINVDGSLSSNHCAGLGVVIRKEDGSLIKAAGKRYLHWDSSQVEWDAVLFCFSLLEPWMFDMEGALIEGDNATVIKTFQNCMDKRLWRSSPDFDRAADVLINFKQVIFSAVSRKCNKAADFCARHAATCSSFCWYDADAHPSFASLLKDELAFSSARRA